MDYQDCVNYIEEIPRFTKKTDLAHTRRLLAELGHPEESLRILHVAGTNGKGSVCAYLQAMLSSGGHRTACFTSPHLEKINERFTVDGRAIPDEAFVRCFGQVRRAAEARIAAGDAHPTYFEFLFLMAMVWFAGQKTDFCILETGLGGRLDATNAVSSTLCSIITSIGLDHTQFLGNTVEEIAAEKAGIIRRGTPVFCDGTDAGAAAVVRQVAQENDSPCLVLEPKDVRVLEKSAAGIRFHLRAGEVDTALSIRQAAGYQVANAALAFLALHALAAAHGLSDRQLAEGLLQMVWPGRMEVVRPDIVLDGAHNAEGAAQFARASAELFPAGERTLLFAVAADKPAREMVRRICHTLRPDRVIATGFSGGRALEAETLAAWFREEQVREVRALPEMREAFSAALQAKGDGVLFAAGSLYLVGAFRSWLFAEEEHHDPV